MRLHCVIWKLVKFQKKHFLCKNCIVYLSIAKIAIIPILQYQKFLLFIFFLMHKKHYSTTHLIPHLRLVLQISFATQHWQNVLTPPHPTIQRRETFVKVNFITNESFIHLFSIEQRTYHSLQIHIAHFIQLKLPVQTNSNHISPV